MGFLEVLFGPDGPGGQPGAVGNAMNAAGGAYKKASETPFASLLTLPTEIIRDPLQFTNSEGKIDIAALLSPNARKTFAQQKQAAQDAAKWKATADAYNIANTAMGIFSKAPTPEARAALAQGMVGLGLQESEFNPFRQSADVGQDAARAAALEAGAVPSLANIADANSAQQLGQTRFASERQLQEIGAQGAETRRNQGNQFGLSKQLLDLKSDARRKDIDYKNEADIRKEQNLDQYRRFKAAGDNTRAAAAVAQLPEAQPGMPLHSLSQAYSTLAAADPSGVATSKLGDEIGSYYTPAQADDQYRSALTDIIRDPVAMEKFSPEEQALIASGLRGENSAKDVYGFVRDRLKPTAASGKLDERKTEISDAIETNKLLAEFLPLGLQRTLALNAKGKGAVKWRDKIIASIDPLQLTDQNSAALINFMGTETFNRLPQERKDYLSSMLRGGDTTAGKAVGELPGMTEPGKAPEVANAEFLNGIKADSTLFATFSPKTQMLMEQAAKVGGEPAEEAVKVAFEELTGRKDKGDLDKLMATPFGRSLLEASSAKKATLSSLKSMDKWRDKSEIFRTGSSVYTTIANAGNRLFGMEPSEFTRERTLLEQAAGTMQAQYVQGLSGATVPEAEFQRLRKNMPDAMRDDHVMFYAKLDAVKAASERDAELVDQQIDAVVRGDLQAFQNISDARGQGASELANKLGMMTPPSPEDEQKWLTPEERQ